MKKITCIILFLYPVCLFSQSTGYFQQKTDFKISVELNTVNQTLDGFVSLNYTNNSPDTLHYIWFHLWPNAYKNDQTAMSEQRLQSGKTDFYFSDESKRGYINKLNFSVDGTPAMLEDHPLYIDVAKLVLPEPLSPGKTIHITTPFHEKIPYLFSRGGYADGQFLITQWYPKPAVYDREGWHPMPYLDQGEYYNEFGDYEVNITLPKEYEVAATGKKIKTELTGNKKTLTFNQENILDFAWFADRHFVTDSSQMVSSSGDTITLYAYYQKESAPVWKNAIQYIRETVINREKQLGAYPYPVISVVEAPKVFDGGMEYPTITSIQPVEDNNTLQELIDHEVGHNWTFGILATNERDFPWMDEGMTSFYTKLFIDEQPAEESEKKRDFISKRIPDDFDDIFYRYKLAEKTDQPISGSSQEFSPSNYYAIIYYKSVLWLKELQAYLGPEMFRKSMQAYYQQWKFKHPYPEDFKKVIEEASGKNVDSLFQLLNTKGEITLRPARQFKVGSFFNFNQTDKYNYLFFSPALGYNYYDKFMFGLLIHNYTIPEPRLHFFLSPMIGTGSGDIIGTGRIGYSVTSYGKIRKFETAIAASRFNMNSYTDSTGKKNFMDYSKVVPSFRLTFRNNNPLSQSEKYLQWKTYFITETSLNFYRDPDTQEEIITYPKYGRYLNELSFVNENYRALYPFWYQAMAQQGNGFIRLTLDVRQFFNYAKEGGLQARVFAGKLIYTNSSISRYKYQRYQLNMTGANGEEDYTYSDYFIGRNEFEGFTSQQIMVRDGNFKIRTDLLSNKIGTSDNWLAAVNLDTDIPRQFNPLQVLPFPVKLKAFLDMGTYSGAWEKDAETGKILYDAGLQLNLAKNVVKIYFPLFYSKVYRDYYKSTIPQGKRFWKTISFSIDFRQIRLKKWLDLPN